MRKENIEIHNRGTLLPEAYILQFYLETQIFGLLPSLSQETVIDSGRKRRRKKEGFFFSFFLLIWRPLSEEEDQEEGEKATHQKLVAKREIYEIPTSSAKKIDWSNLSPAEEAGLQCTLKRMKELPLHAFNTEFCSFESILWNDSLFATCKKTRGYKPEAILQKTPLYLLSISCPQEA